MREFPLWLNTAASLALSAILVIFLMPKGQSGPPHNGVIASQAVPTDPGIKEPTPRDSMSISEMRGGSARTDLAYGIAVNKNTSMTRRWLTLNAAGCPVTIDGAGIKSIYDMDKRAYRFVAVGKLESSLSLSAIEIRFVLFDVWGNHMQTVSGCEIADLGAPVIFDLNNTGPWYADGNDISEFMSSVGYVARVMTSDGKVWLADNLSVTKALLDASLKIAPDELAPDPTPKG